MDFFHGEHLRLDWGLGNPNKTAIIIACLLVIVHYVRYISKKKWSLLLFIALFLGLGICLIHTYSRGGILAAVIGQFGYWAARSKSRFSLPPKSLLICGISLVSILMIYSALPQINAASRYTQGLLPAAEEDHSITNRLRIWKDVPRMMVDAPHGWGIGKSGEAWMQWYQPTSTRYQYRSLVNSHLTWLVEFGWPGRFAYLFGWGFIFSLAFARPISIAGKGNETRRSAGITTGVWVAFAVGAFFSSVAESWVLWILPVICLLWMIFNIYLRNRKQIDWSRPGKEVGAVGVISAALLGAVSLVGIKSKPGIPVYHNGKYVVLGNPPARNFLLQPDEKILGRHYGIHLRENISSSWIVADKPPKERLPREIDCLVMSGRFPEIPENDYFNGEIVILNPSKMLKENSGQNYRRKVILGSLRKDPLAGLIRAACEDHNSVWDLEIGKGRKFFLGNWIKHLQKPKSDNPKDKKKSL